MTKRIAVFGFLPLDRVDRICPVKTVLTFSGNLHPDHCELERFIFSEKLGTLNSEQPSTQLES
jgi:hypothetical protein